MVRVSDSSSIKPVQMGVQTVGTPGTHLHWRGLMQKSVAFDTEVNTVRLNLGCSQQQRRKQTHPSDR